MRHGSLFSGIGGFDLAAEWMGWENVFHCEWMEFPRKVLDYHFPNADSLSDICTTDFRKYANKIDIITGGFPCQPFSQAGKRKGKSDERYLWGEMLRAIQEIKPRFVIAENVYGLTNIDGGLVFEQVCVDLENQGYQVQSFIIPAASKNAPHQRKRVWIIAYTDSDGQYKGRRYDGISENDDGCYSSNEWSTHSKDFNKCDTNGIAQKQSTTCGGIGKKTNVKENETAYSRRVCRVDSTNNTEKIIANHEFAIDKSRALVSQGLKGIFTSTNRRLERNQISFRELATMGLSVDVSRINRMEGDVTNSNKIRFSTKMEDAKLGGKFRFAKCNKWNAWDTFPTQSPIRSGDDGLSTELDGVTFPKWRAESIKGYGNAIVPQVALELFKVIENLNNKL